MTSEDLPGPAGQILVDLHVPNFTKPNRSDLEAVYNARFLGNEEISVSCGHTVGRNPKQPPEMCFSPVNNGRFSISTGAGLLPATEKDASSMSSTDRIDFIPTSCSQNVSLCQNLNCDGGTFYQEELIRKKTP